MKHPYHIVDNSPWPILCSSGLLFFVTGLTAWINFYDGWLVFLGALVTGLSLFQWFDNVMSESAFQGKHTSQVVKMLANGMMLFIISEILFFFSLFWAYFHTTFFLDFGFTLNPYDVPLLNTILLLSSGATITWSHMSILSSSLYEAHISMLSTIMLALFFTTVQLWEYHNNKYTMSDSAHWSVFYVTTGFHGFHVILGTTFIFVMWVRLLNGHFSSVRHLGFEASAWYWHFVDVVWLILFVCVYWWEF